MLLLTIMIGRNKWPPSPRGPGPQKIPKKVHNPVAATLIDPAFRSQKTKNPKLYTRKIKHKSNLNKD